MRSPLKPWSVLDNVTPNEVNITGGSFASVLSYDFPLKHVQNPRQVGYRSFCWLRIFFLTSGFRIHRYRSEGFVYEVITIPLFSWFHSLHKSSSVNIIKIFSFSLCFPFPFKQVVWFGAVLFNKVQDSAYSDAGNTADWIRIFFPRFLYGNVSSWVCKRIVYSLVKLVPIKRSGLQQ